MANIIDLATYKYSMILDDKNFTSGMKKAEVTAGGFESKLKGFTSFLSTSFKAGVLAAGAALSTMAVKGVKDFIEYESAFAGVIKTVDATAEELDALSQGIRDMSKEIPAAATDIASVAEAAGQLGIQTENILDFTRTMIDLGEATNLSSEEAASSLAQFANITQMSQKDFDRLGSTIVALGNNLATTEADIVAMSMRLAGAGKQIGLTEAQIMAFSGALSSVGIEAAAGGSAMSKLMVDMQLAVETGNNSLRDFAQVAGMSVQDFKKAFEEDASGAIITFIQGLASAEEKGMSAIKVLDDMGITDIRLRDTLLRAAGASDVFSDAIKLGTQAWQENTALATEAEQRYATTASLIQILKNNFKDMTMEIGAQLVPTLNNFLSWILDKMPVISSTVTNAFSAIGNVIAVFTQVISMLVEHFKISASENEATIDNMKNIIVGVLNSIGDYVNAFTQFIGNLWDRYGERILSITQKWFNMIATNIESVLGIIKGIFDFFTGLFTGDWEKMGKALCDIVSNAWGIITNIFTSAIISIADILGLAVRMLLDLGKSMMNGLWNGIKAIWGSITGWFSNVFNNLFGWFDKQYSKFKNIGSNLLNSVWNGLKEKWRSISSWFNNTVAWIKDKLSFWSASQSKMPSTYSRPNLPVYDVGTPFVPNDQLALVHKGEMIVPAKYNPYNPNNQLTSLGNQITKSSEKTINLNVNVAKLNLNDKRQMDAFYRDLQSSVKTLLK